jgi:hypothetical protein
VSSAWLESSLLGACPGLRESWDAVRRTHPPGGHPSDEVLLHHVRAHVVALLVTGRAAEFSRFARTVERLLAEADPVLYDLLGDHLLRPLAREAKDARVEPARIITHLGSRALQLLERPEERKTE